MLHSKKSVKKRILYNIMKNRKKGRDRDEKEREKAKKGCFYTRKSPSKSKRRKDKL